MADAAIQFRPATRQRVPLKLAITGPSGSGKTYGALMLAFGLAADGKVAVIDTENGSADLYAQLGQYDTLTLQPPFTTQKYIAAIRAAAQAGYAVLIIDSLSHAWAGEGGLLQQKEQKDARGGNSYTNWAEITKFHEQMKAALLGSPMHVIATMRSKQDYVIETDSRGKSVPRKIGMAPIQREGMEYEFTIVFDVAMNHEASASKDRTGLFDGKFVTLDRSHGEQLRAWLESGAEPLPAPPAMEVVNPPADKPQPKPDAHDNVPLPGPREPLPTVIAFRARVLDGGTGKADNGPVLWWQVQAVDNPLQHSKVWCFHQNQPREATGMDTPEGYRGELLFTLSEQTSEKSDPRSGEVIKRKFYQVEAVSAAM